MTTTTRRPPSGQPHFIEWPTLGLMALTYAIIIAAVWMIPAVSIGLSVPLLVLGLVLHASLTHEVCHGHPLRSRWASEALVFINPGLAIPYIRFRDTHLAHHHDSILTDPYDDPESNYLDPARWASMPGWARSLRRINNTLAGRMLLGPLLGQVAFMADDWRLIRAGDRQVLRAWVWHLPGAALVVWLVLHSAMPLWLYLICVYVALSILKIRTFLEHQAHERALGRTVIIEDRGPLAFLFLNNNLHVVHHMHPRVPWYRLPRLYAANKARYLRANEDYRYRSYGEVFRAYFWCAKDPVPHPLWPSSES